METVEKLKVGSILAHKEKHRPSVQIMEFIYTSGVTAPIGVSAKVLGPDINEGQILHIEDISNYTISNQGIITPSYIHPIHGCTPSKAALQEAKRLRKELGKSDIIISRLIHGQFVVTHEKTGQKVIIYTI